MYVWYTITHSIIGPWKGTNFWIQYSNINERHFEYQLGERVFSRGKSVSKTDKKVKLSFFCFENMILHLNLFQFVYHIYNQRSVKFDRPTFVSRIV